MNINTLRYIQVKEQLMAHIASLKPHERSPSRTALSATYQAARTTIERAISELIGEGSLYARDGSGTYVSESIRPGKRHNEKGTATWGCSFLTSSITFTRASSAASAMWPAIRMSIY
ncbi:winged helix-turn-helix domain-containing protein [Paenibacillus sp. P26]|nr:winged helix-turn-helix domain-containing protein [Paenibacillus sp. P26]